MKICVAQTKSVKGNIPQNIENHKRLIALAIEHGADTIIFPELSLTGYEPTLAKALATTPDDSRFDDFQNISDQEQITIGVGVPLKSNAGRCISMVLFHPHKPRQTYSKKYIHADEEPFFVGGENATSFIHDQPHLALAICYEISVPAHAEHAAENGATMYIASVAKFVNGIDNALQRLSDIARDYTMTVLMANCIGECNGAECAGKTSIWNNKGALLGQLDSTHEGILMMDTNTQEVIEKMI